MKSMTSALISLWDQGEYNTKPFLGQMLVWTNE